MVDDFEDFFKGKSRCFWNTCETKTSTTFPAFPSKLAYVDWVQRGIQWFAFCFLRWPTSALRMPNDTPNSKLYSEFLNLTPNSKTSLRIQKHHSEFTKLTPNSKTSLRIQKSHSEFLNLTPNSEISLRIQKISLRILEPHSEFQLIKMISGQTRLIGSWHEKWAIVIVDLPVIV